MMRVDCDDTVVVVVVVAYATNPYFLVVIVEFVFDTISILVLSSQRYPRHEEDLLDILAILDVKS